jgi:hypothetical protein
LDLAVDAATNQADPGVGVGDGEQAGQPAKLVGGVMDRVATVMVMAAAHRHRKLNVTNVLRNQLEWIYDLSIWARQADVVPPL